ncbi:MAG: hypothetical protein N4A53_02320 [Pelagimonas sp.]|nr:hypothetical protein [Pelagimonas sp.]
MPLSLQDPDIWLIQSLGTAQLDPLLRGFRQFRHRFAATRKRTKLIDLQHVDRFDLDFDQMRRLAARVADFYCAHGLHLVIYAPVDMSYGMARMFQSLVDAQAGLQVTVCRSETEALAAVGAGDTTLAAMIQRNKACSETV